MNRKLYWLHRWVSALALVQLGIWTLTGTFFAVIPIERVRTAGVPHAHEGELLLEGTLLGPGAVLEAAASQGMEGVSILELRASPSGVYYLARNGAGVLRFDARTGVPAPVQDREAALIARRDQPNFPSLKSVTRIEHSPPVEYRGKALPVWRVELDDSAGTTIYVDAQTGEVTARRSTLWRWYDLMWSLHIMDYGDRESFNHPLIVFAGALAVLTVISGAVLWTVRIHRRLTRRT